MGPVSGIHQLCLPRRLYGADGQSAAQMSQICFGKFILRPANPDCGGKTYSNTLKCCCNFWSKYPKPILWILKNICESLNENNNNDVRCNYVFKSFFSFDSVRVCVCVCVCKREIEKRPINNSSKFRQIKTTKKGRGKNRMVFWKVLLFCYFQSVDPLHSEGEAVLQHSLYSPYTIALIVSCHLKIWQLSWMVGWRGGEGQIGCLFIRKGRKFFLKFMLNDWVLALRIKQNISINL